MIEMFAAAASIGAEIAGQDMRAKKARARQGERITQVLCKDRPVTVEQEVARELMVLWQDGRPIYQRAPALRNAKTTVVPRNVS